MKNSDSLRAGRLLLIGLTILAVLVGGPVLYLEAFGFDTEYSLGLVWLAVFATWAGGLMTIIGAIWWITAMVKKLIRKS